MTYRDKLVQELKIKPYSYVAKFLVELNYKCYYCSRQFEFQTDIEAHNCVKYASKDNCIKNIEEYLKMEIK